MMKLLFGNFIDIYFTILAMITQFHKINLKKDISLIKH